MFARRQITHIRTGDRCWFNLTTELSTILHALLRAEATAELRQCRWLFIFSDCQSALDLINKQVSPTGSYKLIRTIQHRLHSLREVLTVQLVWVPAHVGVHDNELANTLAKNAAMAVVSARTTTHTTFDIEGVHQGSTEPTAAWNFSHESAPILHKHLRSSSARNQSRKSLLGFALDTVD